MFSTQNMMDINKLDVLLLQCFVIFLCKKYVFDTAIKIPAIKNTDQPLEILEKAN